MQCYMSLHSHEYDESSLETSIGTPQHWKKRQDEVTAALAQWGPSLGWRSEDLRCVAHWDPSQRPRSEIPRWGGTVRPLPARCLTAPQRGSSLRNPSETPRWGGAVRPLAAAAQWDTALGYRSEAPRCGGAVIPNFADDIFVSDENNNRTTWRKLRDTDVHVMWVIYLAVMLEQICILYNYFLDTARSTQTNILYVSSAIATEY